MAASTCVIHASGTWNLALRLERITKRTATIGAERSHTILHWLERTNLSTPTLIDSSSALGVLVGAGGVVYVCLLEFRHFRHQLHV